MQITSLEILGEGDFCRAFLVNRKLVFRFARHDAARQSLKRELCLLPQIAGSLSLEIPYPRLASFAGEPAECFIAYPFLRDRALTRDEYSSLAEHSRARCAGQVAGFLNEFHATELTVAEKCGVERADYAGKYSHLLERFRRDHFHRLEKEDADRAVREIEDYLENLTSASAPPVLLHGDLSPDHVLFDGAQVTSIIDFGDLLIGDAAWDFLWIYEDYGADFFKNSLAGYNAADKADFVRRVLQFSRLESIEWIAECLENGETDLTETVAHWRAAVAAKEIPISSFFDNQPGN